MKSEGPESLLLIFDLDDTLVSTSTLLVPEALKRAIEIMAGESNLCEKPLTAKLWSEAKSLFDHGFPVREIFHQIASQLEGLSSQFNTEDLVAHALRSYRRPQIPEKLPLLEGVAETLDFLGKRHKLALITRGVPGVQQKKIEALGVASHFCQIVLVDTERDERKEHGFRSVLNALGFDSSRTLVVGDDPWDELAQGKALGCWTCRTVQSRFLNAPTSDRVCDFQIQKMMELFEVVQVLEDRMR